MHSLGAFKDLGAGQSLPNPAPLSVFLTRSLSRNDHVGDAPSVPEWGHEALPEGVGRVPAPPRGRGRSRAGGGGARGGAGRAAGPRQPGRSGRRSRGSESRSHVRGRRPNSSRAAAADGPASAGRRAPVRRARAAGGRRGRRSAAPRCGGGPGGCEPRARRRSPPRRRGSAPRARGMRAADSGTWERVRQLAAQGEPAPSCGAGAGPARPRGPAACEPGADAGGPADRPRAGAPSVRADGDCSQPGRCARGGEGGAAAGPGSRRGRARGGAPGRIAERRWQSSRRAPRPGRREGGRGSRAGRGVLQLAGGGLGARRFPAEPPERAAGAGQGHACGRCEMPGRPGPALGGVGKGASPARSWGGPSPAAPVTHLAAP